MNINQNLYTVEEETFLRENYTKLGPTKCAALMENRTLSGIRYKAMTMGLSNLMSNFNVEAFIQNFNEYTCYILGLIWADGYVYKTSNKIKLLMKSDDLYDIEHIFDKTGKWRKYNCPPPKKSNFPNYSPMTEFSCEDKRIKKFLLENDYCIKSFVSPIKILLKIPDHLKYYWWRGYCDGDGYFHSGKRNRTFGISGPSNYNWEFMIEKFKSMDINYFYAIITNPKGSASTLRVSESLSICKWGLYIYQGFESDCIGFNRKYIKFQEIMFKIKNKLINEKGFYCCKNRFYLCKKRGKIRGGYSSELEARLAYLQDLKNNIPRKYELLELLNCKDV